MDRPFVYCGHPPSMRLDGYSLLETLSYGCFLIGPKSHSPTCLSAVFKSFFLFPFRKALLYSFFIYLLFKTILYKTWTRKVRLRTMNSRNSLKQWLTRRRVKDFFLAADGDNVGPRAFNKQRQVLLLVSYSDCPAS